MDIFKPRGAGGIRPATTDQQAHGRIYNQPRYAHLGGLSSSKKAGSKNMMGVKKPGDGQKVI